MSKFDVSYEFNPFAVVGIDESELTDGRKQMALEVIQDFLKESILLDVSRSRSPVTGGGWEGLSRDYKAFKEDEGGTPVANLELTGALMDSLIVRQSGPSFLLVTVSDDQMGKADGHNDHSGESKLPRRPFIPDPAKGETFSREIRGGIREIIEDILAG